MYNKLLAKVIWVDFKTRKVIDTSNPSHLTKSTQPIPWLCQGTRLKEKLNGYR
jgi:hypothetical protein